MGDQAHAPPTGGHAHAHAHAPLLTAAVLHALHAGAAQAALVWIALEALGVALVLVGNWTGGVLVYRMGMGVNTGRSG